MESKDLKTGDKIRVWRLASKEDATVVRVNPYSTPHSATVTFDDTGDRVAVNVFVNGAWDYEGGNYCDKGYIYGERKWKEGVSENEKM